MKIILASSSPRRAALMNLAQIDCEIIPSNFDEKIDVGEDLEEEAKKMAFGKAMNVFENTQGDRAIIGADTFVVKDGKLFGKPKDRADAIRMLRELQGDYHVVYTGLTILIENHEEVVEHNEVIKTVIEVVPMTDDEIIDYIDKEAPFDKAGSYAIQSSFSRYISRMKGNYMSVIGLPIDRVYKILKENEVI